LGIFFGDGVTWGGVAQLEFQRFGRDPNHPRAVRLHYLALGHANLIGHAEFSSGRLEWLLADKDGKSASATGVSQGIKRAKELGLLDDGSGARCLVLPEVQFQRSGGRGGRACRTHGIGRM
jgi:hypothetical protein